MQFREISPGMQFREIGKDYPIYEISSYPNGKSWVLCRLSTGNMATEFADIETLERLASEGKLELLDLPNRQITCAGCEGTFEVIDDRSGTFNEAIYCASCVKALHGIDVADHYYK